jgi:predicted TIM-barrel fold metal-dependent hydrolase
MMENLKNMDRWRAWDIHVHIPRPRFGGETLIDNMHNALEFAGRVGIEKIAAFLRTDRSPGDGIKDHVVGTENGPSNREIEQALDRFKGRVYGWLYMSLKDDPNHGLDKVNRWAADGPMVAIKLGSNCGVVTRPEYEKVFDRIVELGLPVHTHTWIKTGGDPIRIGGGNICKGDTRVENYPMDVAELARRYPGHPFICIHNGGDWELGTRAVHAVPNVLVEVAGGYPEAGQVECAVKWVGPERVVFGSDAPGARFFGTQVGKVAGADIPDYAKRMIFYENIARILRPICEAKGIPV